MTRARALWPLALAVTSLGCVADAPELPCDAMSMAGRPTEDGARLDIELTARNCASSPRSLGTPECALHPGFTFEDTRWILGIGTTAVSRATLGCDAARDATAFDAGETMVIRLGWDGTLQPEDEPARDAPPGTYHLTAAAFDDFALLSVRIDANGTFTEDRP